MELGPRRFAVLHLAVAPAVVNGEGDIQKGVGQHLWCDPGGGVLGMVVVAVQHQAVGFDEVGVVAIAVFVLHRHIVKADGGGKGGGIGDLYGMRIHTVGRPAQAVRMVEGEWVAHGATSLQLTVSQRMV